MATSKIKVSALEEVGKKLAGVPHGTVLETTDEKGERIKERVVAEVDKDGEPIGWHKEVVKDG